jgi:integrase
MLDVSDRTLRALTDSKLRVERSLYFIARNGRRPSWEFRYTAPSGQRRNMSLGQYPDLPLAEARKRAAVLRLQIGDGIDPIEARAEELIAKEKARASEKTLRLAANEYHGFMLPFWKNRKHAAQWLISLNLLGDLLDQPLGKISSGMLLDRLEPINRETHDTATRIRQRVEAIYDRAIISGTIQHNPALPLKRAIKSSKRKRHFPAIAYSKVPEFILSLRDSDACQSARLAFEFLILSAARTSEILFATWSEVNLERRIWVIPPERMKRGAQHEVPLTDRMVEILQIMHARRDERSPWIFPSPQRQLRPLSTGVFLTYIRRLGLARAVTGHGMRSAFSTFCHETQNVRSEIVGAALAHREADAVKAAYSRGEYWNARISIAEAWTSFCAGDQSAGKTTGDKVFLKPEKIIQNRV